MTTRAIEGNQTEASATLRLTEVSGRKYEFDYLRTFAVVLVLWDHAILAYTKFAFINLENPMANSNPVVNEQRWIGFDLMVAFNETFFMPLLFFVSGIFVWQGLTRKGARKYFGGRLTRLGLPFVIGVLFLIPLAYYPAQLQTGTISGEDASYGAFWLGMVRSGFGTAGPLWFLWLLLAFNGIATLLYKATSLSGGFIKERLTFILDRPVVFLGVQLGITMVVYVPVAIIIGPLEWIGIGPFKAQAGRILLYLVYFLTGTAVGVCGLDHSALRCDGELARRWWVWLVASLISFSMFIIMLVVVTSYERTIVSEIAFVVCCWATVFGMTGVFLRYANRRIPVFDNLSENSYGIYIVHYLFITWLQYLLLGSTLVPGVKATVVFTGTLTLSWGASAAIRRIPLVAKAI